MTLDPEYTLLVYNIHVPCSASACGALMTWFCINDVMISYMINIRENTTVKIAMENGNNTPKNILRKWKSSTLFFK